TLVAHCPVRAVVRGAADSRLALSVWRPHGGAAVHPVTGGSVSLRSGGARRRVVVAPVAGVQSGTVVRGARLEKSLAGIDADEAAQNLRKHAPAHRSVIRLVV